MTDVQIMERNGVEFIRLAGEWESKKIQMLFLAMSILLYQNTHTGQQLNSFSDMWSIGVVLYKLATHEYPEMEQMQDPFSRASLKRIQRPYNIQDDELWNLISGLICFNQQQRLSASDALTLPYFNSERTKAETSEEVKLIAQQRISATERGENWVLKYDMETSFIVPWSEIKFI
ncbi:MAG: hypothetical protein EZS28_030470 [Streblomastix strix]|uniref:Protein kinase domain-containing protein n=1 Tax=Streblomastix strix TaxID=222440 RepID=A0A5J4UUI3_9EUKA|nr:MAG: hypothetical protein EZS28_030470 [Streblomastix strix]